LLHKLLQSEAESEVLELKKAEWQFDTDKLGKYFSALGNEANLMGKDYAYLIMGVLNDKTIVGTSITEKQLNEYKRLMTINTSPALSFSNVHRVSTADGDVLIYEIPAAPKGLPIAWKGHRYGRDGESLVALNDNEYERIRSQVAADWSMGIISEASLDDLDTEAIAKAREQFKEKNPRLSEDIERWDNTQFLNKAKITVNSKITTTAILLLGKAESEHYINPASATITWILRDRDNIEKDYEHFSCPLILNVGRLYAKVRNLKYRYISGDSLFPDEVDQYDPFTIREATNNCIAHKDYTKRGKINVVEYEDAQLVFVNSGSFIPGSIEKVVNSDAPEDVYRNPFLANAMVSLNMIDTMGSGIKRLFTIQKNKFFPLPEYDFSNGKVKVTIIGKVMNVDYARKLAQMPNLSLYEIMLLDKVQKDKELDASEIKRLRSKNLIEGRKPNFHISVAVAHNTGQESDYFKQKGIDDQYCKKIIVDYLTKFGKGKRSDFEKILLNKLPEVLNDDQKRNKIKNNLQALKKEGAIIPEGKLWKKSKKE
ncbi:MAG: putative DNA binding domain-containing protein, partial [Bacteroidales bacterium]|nr:putative DNA binding domain-containing protein [Bacteroidales bacterium]